MEKSNLIVAEKEYQRIDENWLRLHFKTAIGLVIFTFIIECIVSYSLFNMGEIHTTLRIYIMKFLFVPLLLNLMFIAVGNWAINSPRLTHNVKVYIVSFLLVGICFVLFTVHSIFTSLYLIFTGPILFTIVYNNYKLTTVISLCSIFLKIFSELFIEWDSYKPDVMANNIDFVNFIISVIYMCAFYAVSIVIIYFEKDKNAANIQKELECHNLKQRLHFDELTEINNRRALQRAFQSIEEDKSINNYIFVMIDIDDFKALNDNLGHYKGDLILSEFGNILKSNCTEATPFRFGGDEFCILFKNQELKTVLEKCKEIQKNFIETGILNGIKEPLTVSIGIAKYSYEMTTLQLFKNADSALYNSKKVKNTIVIYPE